MIAHQPGGIPVAFKQHRWLMLLLPIFLLKLFSATLRIAKSSDLIHANWAITGAIAGIAGKLSGTPVITTLRGSDISRSEKHWLDRQILKICLKTSRKIITVCSPLREQIHRQYPWAEIKLGTIANGVDDAFLAIQKQYTNRKMLRIISIGSLIPRKSMSTILKAAAILKQSENIILEIIGNGIENQELRELGKQLEFTNNLEMPGDIPSTDIPNHLREADIFVLASQSEGRPNVVIEAFAAGVPVVASDIDGNKEIIQHEHNGLLFPQGDHIALANALKYLAQNPDFRKNIAQEGRNFIYKNQLSWKNCAEQYLDVYKNIINKKYN
jgi:glycosyltransferase involved in cell wall biosynthesis